MGEEGTGTPLTHASWALLRRHRAPVLAAATGVTLGGLVAAATAFATQLSLQPHVKVYGSAYRTAGFGLPDAAGPPSSVTTLRPGVATAVVFVVGYLALAAVVTLTSAAITAAAHRALAPDDERDGTTASSRGLIGARLRPLLAWSALNGTLGLVHRLVEKRPVLGLVAGRINGLSWRHATWLAVPTILTEGTRPLRTLRRSAELHTEAWGRDALPRTGLGRIGTALVVATGLCTLAATPFGSGAALATAALLAAAAGTVIATLAGTNRAVLHRHAAGLPLPAEFAIAAATSFTSRNQPVAVEEPVIDEQPAPVPVPAVAHAAASLAEVDAQLDDAVALLPRRERLRLRPPGYRRPGPQPQPTAGATSTPSASMSASAR